MNYLKIYDNLIHNILSERYTNGYLKAHKLLYDMYTNLKLKSITQNRHHRKVCMPDMSERKYYGIS